MGPAFGPRCIAPIDEMGSSSLSGWHARWRNRWNWWSWRNDGGYRPRRDGRRGWWFLRLRLRRGRQGHRQGQIAQRGERLAADAERTQIRVLHIEHADDVRRERQ